MDKGQGRDRKGLGCYMTAVTSENSTGAHAEVCLSHPSSTHCSIIRNFVWLLNPVIIKNEIMDFPGFSVVRNPPANAGDVGLIPGLGGFHVQLSCVPQPLSPCAL